MRCLKSVISKIAGSINLIAVLFGIVVLCFSISLAIYKISDWKKKDNYKSQIECTVSNCFLGKIDKTKISEENGEKLYEAICGMSGGVPKVVRCEFIEENWNEGYVIMNVFTDNYESMELPCDTYEIYIKVVNGSIYIDGFKYAIYG